ncbi:MAG: GNAT family N-acetyltransferase [Verrucomicrobiota bacterium]
MNATVSLRPVTDEDRDFLLRVYDSTREEEMQLAREYSGWDDEQVEQFMAQQFHAQDTFYRQHFPNTKMDVILDGDRPVGRLYVDRRVDEIRVIDIALLTPCRGKGIGGQLMNEILDEGRSKNLPVRIHVQRGNVAMHLYDRLGFKKIEEQSVYDLMEWTPGDNGTQESESS